MADLLALKLGLLGLWAAWFSLVSLGNVFDALQRAGIVSANWRFVSGNFQQVCEAVATYRCAAWCAVVLYGGVIAWELAVTALMWWALAASIAVGAMAFGPVNLAFTAALALWAAFLLAEEIFRQYRTESKHLLFFIAQLLTLTVLHGLPD